MNVSFSDQFNDNFCGLISKSFNPDVFRANRGFSDNMNDVINGMLESRKAAADAKWVAMAHLVNK